MIQLSDQTSDQTRVNHKMFYYFIQKRNDLSKWKSVIKFGIIPSIKSFDLILSYYLILSKTQYRETKRRN